MNGLSRGRSGCPHVLESTGIQLPIEIEVDTLSQLRDALHAKPEIVLLDIMSCDEMEEAVRIRIQESPGTRLVASGGVTLDTVRAIAETGVERISIGGLTHSRPPSISASTGPGPPSRPAAEGRELLFAQCLLFAPRKERLQCSAKETQIAIPGGRFFRGAKDDLDE